ncbi:MAG TPA: hypothetical protein VFJ43_14660 [Bacteroidia bacterium]|nr:hypothetical protein [Bacteroidia bacterium]
MNITKIASLLILVFSCSAIRAQVNSQAIVIHGRVYDKNDSSATPSAIVLNKRTSTGLNASPGTMFSINGIKSDTFLITAGGYEVIRISFRDSIPKDVYTIRVGLQMKTTVLTSVAIYPIKDLNEISKERSAIGKEQTRQTIGLTDAVESPITYLYERFSREGKSKEAVAILENEDRKREILKELFRTYVRAGVIVMDESEFDSFINYLNLPESFLRSASDYDLAVVIRQRYLVYRNAQEIHNRNQR